MPTMSPFRRESVDPEPSKVTLRGAVPVDGVADMTAVGGWLLTTPETRQHVISAS